MEPEKTDEKVINPEEVDETELDKALEDSINSVKAGNELSPQKEEVKTEEPKEETPETPEETPEEKEEEPEAPESEDPSTPPVDEEKPEGYDFRIPNKGKFESDESYEKRIELMDLVKKRKLAHSDEQRQQISEEIKTTKGQLKSLNGSDRLINPLNEKSEVGKESQEEEEDESIKADKERLKQLGGATKEDIQEMLQRERLANEVKSTLNTFVGRHKELGDVDAREVFFDFVDSNYNWQNKSGKELMTVLELARESMFKPDETITERMLKGAGVQEKVNAMQFPGGTVAKNNYSPEMKSSMEELMATGLSEEKALELLSEDE
jgi:hypothetical protein